MSLNLVLSEMVAIHEHIIKNIWNRNLDSDIQTKRLNQILIEKVDCAVNYYCRNWHWCQFNFLRWNLEKFQIMFCVCFNELQFHIQQCNVKGTDQTLSGWKKVIKLTFSIFQGSLFCGWFTFATFGIKFACNSIHMTNAPGCFIWNFVISNGSTTEMVQFWLHVPKQKCVWEAADFFKLSNICLHFPVVCLQFIK